MKRDVRVQYDFSIQFYNQIITIQYGTTNRNAARKRGVVDPESQLMVDCGSAGNFNLSYLSSFQYLIY